MTGLLQTTGGDPIALCKHCSAKAVGPCATCHEPVCGDCCVLTQHGAETWAICLGCERSHGHSLGSAWRSLGFWLVAPLVGLALLLVVLNWLFG